VARPNWEYIRVDVLLPEHPKTDGLSDKAFRTLIELWCWCGLNRTDGFVRDAKWKTFGTKAARDQLQRAPVGCKHGFAERVDGGYQMHDYVGPDGHPRSTSCPSGGPGPAGREPPHAGLVSKCHGTSYAKCHGKPDSKRMASTMAKR
jgi:hypothetical protein